MIRPALIVGLILGSTGAAFAQPRSYTVNLTEAELSVVARALGRQPYDEAAPVIARISQQIQAQSAAVAPAEPKDQGEKPAAPTAK